MNIDPNQFWNLLSHSQLVPQQGIEPLVVQVNSQLEDNKGQQANASQIADILIENNVITKYQAEILLAGREGPFRFGDYLVLDRIEDGPLSGSFAARHLRSGHPVVLEFVVGDDDKALKTWKSLKRKAESTTKIACPNLANFFESVALSEYRVLVSQQIDGTPLSSKLPRKARLPWKDACGIAAQIANGLAELHATGNVHAAISPRCIWLVNKGPATLRQSFLSDSDFRHTTPKMESVLDYRAPEWSKESKPTTASDVYSLGCSLHRMIRGLSPFAEYEPKQRHKAHQSKQPATLEKYKLPEELESLLASMLHKSPDKRPDAKSIASKLAAMTGKPDKVFAALAPALATESNFRDTLRSQTPLVGSQPVATQAAPKIETPDAAPARPPIDESFTPTEPTRPTTPRKKKSKTPVLIVFGSMVALACLIGFGAWWAMNTEFQKPKVIVNNGTGQDDSDPKIDDGNETLVAGQGSRLVQVFVADDGKELWETPTEGQPVSFSYLPTGVQIAMAIRPSSLLGNPEGERTLRGLGPQFGDTKKWLTTASGLDLAEMDQLLVGFSSTNQVQFSTCYVVRPVKPIPRSQLVQLWRPQVTDRDEETGVYDNGQGLGYFVIADTNNPEMAVGFAMGPVDQMRVVADLAGANPLPSTLNSLAIQSDDQRHFNLLFIKNSLFNDEGQALLSGSLKPIRQYLRVHLPENLQSGLVSLHLDNGFYLETYVDHRPEIKPSDMAIEIDKFLEGARDAIAVNLASAEPNPYWDQVRSRFAIMVTEIYRNLRVGTEGPDVLANCWLPEIAAHNLATGAELALTFSGGSTAPPVVQIKIPATLEELLNSKRDLSVTTNPDLGLLLAGIKTSIADDYGELPFAFDIKLVGNDLLKDGITQNQRPGDFELMQKTLSEILTEIMYRANPDKDATGPNDPACKLVWVVGEDPAGSGTLMVLITTRDAVAAKGYTLPAAFVIPE